VLVVGTVLVSLGVLAHPERLGLHDMAADTVVRRSALSR
jgi:uncharacterized RDD family membrane protein YckC